MKFKTIVFLVWCSCSNSPFFLGTQTHMSPSLQFEVVTQLLQIVTGAEISSNVDNLKNNECPQIAPNPSLQVACFIDTIAQYQLCHDSSAVISLLTHSVPLSWHLHILIHLVRKVHFLFNAWATIYFDNWSQFFVCAVRAKGEVCTRYRKVTWPALGLFQE